MLNSLKDNKFWLLFGVAMILTRMILSQQPMWVDAWYTHGIYQLIRPAFDYTLGWLPFPSFYLFLIVVAVGITWKLGQWVKLRRLKARTWGYFLMSTISMLIFFVGLFLFVWGFNYAGSSVEQKMGFTLQAISPEDLRSELEEQTQLVSRLRDEVQDSIDTNRVFSPEVTGEIRRQLVDILAQYNFPHRGQPRLRFLYPKGSLLAISTAGFYWPFVGECHVDPGLHSLQIPHVIAHELAHAYSITDEGACNFIAWLACRQSNDPYVRYAGQLSYWRQLNASYRRTNKEDHRLFFETVDPRIVGDLHAIIEQMEQYPEYFTAFRNLFYGSYLKVQGVSEGLASYGRVVNLVMSWKKQERSSQ